MAVTRDWIVCFQLPLLPSDTTTRSRAISGETINKALKYVRVTSNFYVNYCGEIISYNESHGTYQGTELNYQALFAKYIEAVGPAYASNRTLTALQTEYNTIYQEALSQAKELKNVKN
jgi:hypothetical protein